MQYNYFIPLINLGPFPGYTFIQELPLKDIQKLIIGSFAKFEIIRRVYLSSKQIYEYKGIIEYKNDSWMNSKAASFSYSHSTGKRGLSFIETEINLLLGEGLRSSSVPSFYVSYISKKKKNYISCGYEKYGNPRVIMQMKEFGMWIDGYPSMNININNNTTYSIAIVNPYKIINSFMLEINSLKIKKSFRVPSQSVKQINLYDIVKKSSWTGQCYIYGKKRLITFVINHDFKNLYDITTLEHSDPFRAELSYQPRLQYVRNLLHRKIKRFQRSFQ